MPDFVNHRVQDYFLNLFRRFGNALNRALVDNYAVRKHVAVIPFPLRERHALIKAEKRAGSYSHIVQQRLRRPVFHLNGDIGEFLFKLSGKFSQGVLNEYFECGSIHD